METIKLFLSLLFAGFLLDMTWLGLIAKNLYGNALGNLLRKSGDSLAPNWPAAILVYVAIITGIILFAIPKTNGSYPLALVWGGLFGLIVYAIYDLTNLSILANWPVKISIIDIIWGSFLCAVITLLGVFLQNNYFKI